MPSRPIDYKLVCWKDFVIPIQESFNWLAFGKRTVIFSKEKPMYSKSLERWYSTSTNCVLYGNIPPPEKDRFSNQIYDIS